jgi:hypothetical protein
MVSFTNKSLFWHSKWFLAPTSKSWICMVKYPEQVWSFLIMFKFYHQ